jgi:outer membrane protein TolC
MSSLSWKPQWLVATMPGSGALSLSAMVNRFETVWGRRRILLNVTPWIAATLTGICLVAAMLIVTAGGPVQGAELKPDNQVLTSATPMSYDDAVKIAISHSPAFTKSSVQIELKRMDQSDARYGMVPPVTFRTVYYVNRPNASNLNPTPYSLSFSADPYNPFGSYFTLQAEKVATQMAILSHLQVISKGLMNLGGFYLIQSSLKQMAAYQKAMVDLDREILTYAENRLSIGTGTSLEVKVAQQELQLAQGELEQIKQSEKRNLAEIRRFLGLPPSAEFNPDLRDCRHQVLRDFNPATATVEQAKNNSYEIKLVDLTKKLQGYKVLLAKASVMPNLLFNTQTPDPLNASVGNGLYVGIGLEIPVWDGFKRLREVSRQKAILKQVDATKEEKANSLENLWASNVDEIQIKSLALKVAKSREELVRLKAHQNELRYQSGEITLPVYLESRKQTLEAEKDTLKKSVEYDQTVLKLREISGDLGNTYVDPNSWQK